MKATFCMTAILITTGAFVGNVVAANSGCNALPSHASLTASLQAVVVAGGNGGLGHDMWGTIVDRDGIVCQVAKSGLDRGDQWPGSRVISGQKANTANAFSLPNGSRGAFPGLSLSTANLFSAVQPGGSLFGLQLSNPVDTKTAYKGPSQKYGQSNDPMRGKKIGGVNVFGGGLALYDSSGALVGALGVSGDTSCTDHNVAWKVRDALGLDHVPAGISPTGDDNIIYDTAVDGTTGHTVSVDGFGHPECDAAATTTAVELPVTHPIDP